MKKIKCFLLLLIGLILCSCEKEMMSYEGTEGIYFSVKQGEIINSVDARLYTSSTEINFIDLTTNEVDIDLEVSISGPIKNYDRIFLVQANKDSSTAIQGTHYDFKSKEWVIPANQNHGFVKIKLYKTIDLDEHIRTLILDLIPNEYFELALPNSSKDNDKKSSKKPGEFNVNSHSITFSNGVSAPALWSSFGGLQGGKESNIYGHYSPKKMQFITENFNIKHSDFNSISIYLIFYIQNQSVRILQEKYDAGMPILENDGRLMWFSGVSWESIVGVPWKP